ncbi:MAG: exodeoxyribonuclease VII large subunit [Phototrophicaceae bacterium]
MTNPHDFRSITDVNANLKSLVENVETSNDYFWLGGSVSQKFTSSIGHTYFILKDQKHSISCMLPNKYSEKAVYITKGTMVDVYGAISFYQKEAKVQVMVSDIRLIELDNSGIDYTVLKHLKSNGLLPKAKKDLPKSPQQISIITSRRSEALSDFKHIYKEQKGKATLEILDASVQGDKAPEMIANRIREANNSQKADIILLTRGGGRTEDLSVFNSIEVAVAICQSTIPIVTGIGHQRDETIADHVADQKTISPTDAAYKLATLSVEDISKHKSKKQGKNHIFIIVCIILLLISMAIIMLLLWQQ